MIGKAYRLGTGFKGLAAYLERGRRDRPQPGRVDWIESRNLPTRDPQAAARIMAATARDSERVRKPVYHFSVSFDPCDPVDRATMRRIADRTLSDLGLQEHQVLIVAHRDRQHPHMHFIVNTVHPERRRAWSNSWDYRRIETSLRAQEADFGLRVVPGRHAPVPERARRRVERGPAPVRGDAAFVARVRAEVGPHLARARTWDELERPLAERGLALRIKGRGMVITDGAREVKASEIDPAASRFRLERRLGRFSDHRARDAAERTPERGTAHRPPPPQVRARTDARRAEPPRRTPRIRQEAPHTQAAPPAGLPTPAPPAPPIRRTRPRTYREAAHDFARETRALYADPRAARRAFLDAAARGGADRAAAALRQRPERFGALRPGADSARAAHAALIGFDYVRHRAARLRPVLQHAARLLRDAARADPRNRYSDLREAAAVLNSAQIGRAVTPDQLARRLAPMLPRSAAGLAQQALRIAHELVREQEREHGRERGLSF